MRGALGPPFLPAKRGQMQKEAVKQAVEEWMEGTSFFLVNVRISPDNDIRIEFESETDAVTIDDCVSLSQYIESRFDRNIEDYALEVGSAGLGQPFNVLKQFEINIGNEVDVLPKSGKKHTGILKSVNSEGFSIEVKKKIKTETSKRPVLISEIITFRHEDVKSVCYVVHFS